MDNGTIQKQYQAGDEPVDITKLCTAPGEPAGSRVVANEGYVFYDSEAHNTITNIETMEEIPIIYYYRVRYFPRSYDWSDFSLVAVEENSVPSEQIF